MIFAHPTCDERDQRQPEEQMKVCTQRRTDYAFSQLEHVMVVVPIDTQNDKAHHVRSKDGNEVSQRAQISAFGDLQSQYHNRDDDRKYAVTESFESGRFHSALSLRMYPTH